MFKEFKPIFFFLLKFFVTYIVLTFVYSTYLEPYLSEYKIADPFTAWTTDAAVNLMNFIGFDAKNIQLEGEAFRRFWLDGTFASIVNEGCNAISVMIIFVSFIIAFSTNFLQTSLFIFFGLFAMLVTNIIRVALLTYIYRYMPEYSQSAHDYLFPAIIYGMVVILWLIWVNFFVFKKKSK